MSSSPAAAPAGPVSRPLLLTRPNAGHDPAAPCHPHLDITRSANSCGPVAQTLPMSLLLSLAGGRESQARGRDQEELSTGLSYRQCQDFWHTSSTCKHTPPLPARTLGILVFLLGFELIGKVKFLYNIFLLRFWQY